MKLALYVIVAVLLSLIVGTALTAFLPSPWSLIVGAVIGYGIGSAAVRLYYASE